LRRPFARLVGCFSHLLLSQATMARSTAPTPTTTMMMTSFAASGRDIFGLNRPDNGRSCDMYAICGMSLQLGERVSPVRGKSRLSTQESACERSHRNCCGAKFKFVRRQIACNQPENSEGVSNMSHNTTRNQLVRADDDSYSSRDSN
jgi:hypothetical protein